MSLVSGPGGRGEPESERDRDCGCRVNFTYFRVERNRGLVCSQAQKDVRGLPDDGLNEVQIFLRNALLLRALIDVRAPGTLRSGCLGFSQGI